MCLSCTACLASIKDHAKQPLVLLYECFSLTSCPAHGPSLRKGIDHYSQSGTLTSHEEQSAAMPCRRVSAKDIFPHLCLPCLHVRAR